MPNKLTTTHFIDRAQKVHGNRYDYTNSVYAGADSKIAIVCPTHGQFQQRAMDHMKGRGCSLCNEKQQLTKKQFVERANHQHNSKYKYNKSMYTNVITKVKIICSDHGIFKQTPKDHLHGYGCPTCGGVGRVTIKNFIRRANVAHGKAYEYHNTNLVNMNKKVTITCKIHGDFEQRPADHVNGVGCSICGTRKQGGGYSEEFFSQHPEMKNTAALLYLIQVDKKFCKVGVTKKKYVKQRFPGVKFSVITTKAMPLYQAFRWEQHILENHTFDRYKTKNLQILGQTGWTECFPLSLLPTLKQEFENMKDI